MKKLTFLAMAAVCLAAAPARADVQLTIHDGLVSLNAQDVTLRQILAEWARIGQTKIVNAERVPGGPVTLQLTNVPEERALEILLRSLSGYMAAPRPNAQANTSRFDRIVVMPTVAAPRAASAAIPSPPSPPMPQPQFNPQVQFNPQPNDGQEDPTRNGVPPQPVPPGNRPGGPVFNPFPQVVTEQPNQGGVQGAPNGAPPTQIMTPSPTAPPGAAVPGMVVQPPPQTGQQPNQQPR